MWVNARQQRRRSGRWVRGLCQVHEDQRNGCCEGSCHPLKSWCRIRVQVQAEDDANDDADDSTEEVPENKSSRLC